MTTFKELAQKKNLIILDGPMGTELERRGYDVNDALWSAKFLKENPDAIKTIHRDYYEAGADIVTCASYQATIPGFLKAGLSETEAEELIRRSMQLVFDARREWWENGGKDLGRVYPMAAGDIGPYGAYLADGSEYTGNYHLTEKEYRDFHLRRMEILKDAGAEIFAVETCPRLDEALVSAKLLEELKSDYWISFTFKNKGEISDGTSIREVAKALEGLPHLQAVSVNCTAPELVSGIISNFKACSDLPFMAYPNSGEVYDGITKTWHGVEGGNSNLENAISWYIDGVAAIGGCCRTRPEDIKAIADWSKGNTR